MYFLIVFWHLALLTFDRIYGLVQRLFQARLYSPPYYSSFYSIYLFTLLLLLLLLLLLFILLLLLNYTTWCLLRFLKIDLVPR